MEHHPPSSPLPGHFCGSAPSRWRSAHHFRTRGSGRRQSVVALDADRWRERGSHVRAVESLRGLSHAATRGSAEYQVRANLAKALADLPVEEQATAVAVAVDGYLAEHQRRGGTVSD